MLLDALELVTGEPFDDIACEWPNIAQLRWQASQSVEDAVVHAVDVALAADDLVSARQAVSHGLVGLARQRDAVSGSHAHRGARRQPRRRPLDLRRAGVGAPGPRRRSARHR